jgi:hypothetical protein
VTFNVELDNVDALLAIPNPIEVARWTTVQETAGLVPAAEPTTWAAVITKPFCPNIHRGLSTIAADLARYRRVALSAIQVPSLANPDRDAYPSLRLDYFPAQNCALGIVGQLKAVNARRSDRRAVAGTDCLLP